MCRVQGPRSAAFDGSVALCFPSTRGQLGVQALVIGQSLETARSLPAPLQGLVPFSSQGVGIGPFRVGTVRIRAVIWGALERHGHATLGWPAFEQRAELVGRLCYERVIELCF